MLIVFSGLPGSGKTSLARGLARELEAVHVRIDTIEDSLLQMGGEALVAQGAGYCVAYAVAEENLKLGRTVIADFSQSNQADTRSLARRRDTFWRGDCYCRRRLFRQARASTSHRSSP